MVKRVSFYVLSAMIVLSLGSTASAGILTNVTFFGDGQIYDTALNALNNDNVVVADPTNIFNGIPITDYNWAGVLKDYRDTNPIDIVLDVAPTGGTTEYLILEGVANLTGKNWDQYTIELGIGVGDTFQPLTAVGADGLGLNFDIATLDPTPLSLSLIEGTIFANLLHGTDTLVWDNGLLKPTDDDGIIDLTERAFFAYSIDIPDVPSAPNGYQFTLRQTPRLAPDTVVPEPATIFLLSSGLIGSIAFRRKQ